MTRFNKRSEMRNITIGFGAVGAFLFCFGLLLATFWGHPRPIEEATIVFSIVLGMLASGIFLGGSAVLAPIFSSK